jgi:hypothetical protein
MEVISRYKILCLPCQEASARASVRCTDLQSHPTECLAFTSLTREELQPLVPPCEAAVHAPMAVWRLEGQSRTARRFAVYNNGP